MLRKLHSLKSFEVHGRDAKLGKVDDFYFDQSQFVVRYLVLDTGNWLKQEETLISTHAIDNIDYDSKKIMVELTKDQLEDSPSIKKNEPISKVKEQEIIDYFGWPDYWEKSHSSDSELIHAGISERKKLLDFKVLEKEKEAQEKAEIAKTNLRSVEEVRGYKIHAKDENFGHIEDFFVEEEDSWIIRYILVDTGKKIEGKKSVLISPDWIHSISWHGKEIFVDKDKDQIASAPKYEEEKSKNLLPKSYEEMLYDHYDEDKYW
jgi:hypothetical protein